jgi:hypothetical protein
MTAAAHAIRTRTDEKVAEIDRQPASTNPQISVFDRFIERAVLSPQRGPHVTRGCRTPGTGGGQPNGDVRDVSVRRRSGVTTVSSPPFQTGRIRAPLVRGGNDSENRTAPSREQTARPYPLLRLSMSCPLLGLAKTRP